ncbi:MAG: SGNH/GDSL hydrolase family protein [Limnochordia bacterium]|jgi:lysophospholipase L1-like esterase
MAGTQTPFLDTIIAYEEQDRQQPPPAGAVLFVGSSTIRLWDTLAQDFAPIPVINRGFGGSTVAQATGYAHRIVWPYKPRLIVLYSGDNDLARGKSPESVFADYEEFVTLTHQHLPKTDIALVSTKPSPARIHLLEAMRTLNGLVYEFTLGDSRLTYIDLFSAMLGADGKPREELFGPDGLHLNRTGYQLWTKVIRPYLS